MKLSIAPSLIALILLPACSRTPCPCETCHTTQQADVQQIVYLPGPNSPRPEGGFDPDELWKPARGNTKDRMKLVGEEDPDPYTSNFDTTIYRTVWNSPITDGEDWLLVLKHPRGALGSFTQWDVYAYDKNHVQVLHGRVSFSEMTPLGIVEVKAQGEHLPEEHNNQWILAIIASRNAKANQSLDAQKLWADDTLIDVELVRWDYFWEELPYGYGNLLPDEIDTIEFRHVERDLHVTPAGVLKLRL